MSADASPTRSTDQRLAQAALVGAVVLGVLVFIYDPAVEGPFPPCIFSLLTGLQCAGCGTLRGLHCLVHGDVVGAWNFNPLMVIALPFALGAILWVALGFPLRLRPVHAWSIISVLILFTIARNL